MYHVVYQFQCVNVYQFILHDLADMKNGPHEGLTDPLLSLNYDTR